MKITPKFSLPDQAINQHTAILGKTGSGKTVVAKGIVEKLLDLHRQCCILDPTGAWYGLRIAADGKGKGYDVVLLGGQHADIPLAERSGEAVARLVTEQGASVVIDTSGFTVGQYTRWFIDFAGTLYTTIRSPLHLVIDEAHHFMPQGKSPDVDAGRMLHAGNRLMSGGRSKGVRGMLITQRPAKLHKDSLTCADTLIAMRVMAPQDRNAIKEWIDGAGDPVMGKTVLDSLAQLSRGEGWVWYPEGGVLERVTFPMMKTYDSSATPEHGAKAGPKVGEIKLDEVKAAMAEAVKEAEANDPKKLRARIAELERAAKVPVKPGIVSPSKPIDTAPIIAKAKAEVCRGFMGLHRELTKTAADIEKAARSVLDRAESLKVSMGAMQTILEAGVAVQPQPQHPSRNAATPKVLWEPASQPHLNGTAKAETQPSGDLERPQQDILDTVLMLNNRGLTPDREMVARWLGIHPKGGRYGTNLGFLRGNGYLDGLAMTDSGRAAAREVPYDLDAAMQAVGEEPRREILKALLAAGRPLGREELAEVLGLHPKGGRYGTNLGWLRTMGLITERGPISVTSAAHGPT